MKIQAKLKPLKTSMPQADDADHHADSNHQSAELIGSNDDLLTEILIQLPAKSIIRFKSVSKQWLSLLTHPRFTLRFDKLLKSPGFYYHKYRKLHVSFDVENPTTPPFRSLGFYPDICSFDDSSPDINGIIIKQSCNGLLLCGYGGICSSRYYVLNPTTKKLAVIPPVMGFPYVGIRFMGLAFHPTERVHYKLVCILHVGEEPQTWYSKKGHRMYYIQIYSSKTGKWKKLSRTYFTPRCYPYFSCGVYWNGAFHWVPCRMYLRLDNEEIQDLPMPSSPLPVRFTLYFGESRGHLHLVDTADNKNFLNMNVYEMLRDHSGWFIKYQLDLSELRAAHPNMTHEYKRFNNDHFSVLDVVVGGEAEEDTFMVVKAFNNIETYNILDQSFKKLVCIPNIEEEISHTHRRYIEKIGSF